MGKIISSRKQIGKKMTQPKTVYQLISEVSAEMAKEGISKNNKNQTQGYKFRGIDDVYNALAPIMSKAGLVVLPRVLSRECLERQTKSGGVLFYTTVEMEFDFVSSFDGSKHVVKTFGEAMDSADKSTNKAMSAAYKYACMQSFCIPTEGDNDADAVTHTLAPIEKPKAPELSPEEQKARDEAIERCKPIADAIKSAKDLKQLETILKLQESVISGLPEDLKKRINDRAEEKRRDLSPINAG